MHEVRTQGAGGQGAVLACSILAQALIDDGNYAVAIPSFGFERRRVPRPRIEMPLRLPAAALGHIEILRVQYRSS